MKEIGKIESVRVGMGGYLDAMFGYDFVLSGRSWGCGDFWGAWAVRHDGCKWTEDDRAREWSAANLRIIALMRDAKVESVADLKNVPIEATLENMTLKSWRILTEVL